MGNDLEWMVKELCKMEPTGDALRDFFTKYNSYKSCKQFMRPFHEFNEIYQECMYQKMVCCYDYILEKYKSEKQELQALVA